MEKVRETLTNSPNRGWGDKRTPQTQTGTCTHSLRSICLLLGLGVALLSQPTSPHLRFEVASIRASTDDPVKGLHTRVAGGPGTPSPTRFVAENLTVGDLIKIAYGLRSWQFPDAMRLGTTMFNVAAIVPEGATREQFRSMLQNMLADRFDLRVHRDMREMYVYVLVGGKNGAKFGEPACKPEASSQNEPRRVRRLSFADEGYPELPPTGPATIMRHGRARMRACAETMEHFASIVSGLLGGPVHDETGLKGKYDFTLSWKTASHPASNAGLPDAPEFDSGPDLTEALHSQLGLSLKRTKDKAEVLVVDQIRKLPTPN